MQAVLNPKDMVKVCKSGSLRYLGAYMQNGVLIAMTAAKKIMRVPMKIKELKITDDGRLFNNETDISIKICEVYSASAKSPV